MIPGIYIDNLAGKLEDLNLAKRDRERSLNQAKEENQRPGKDMDRLVQDNQNLKAENEKMGTDNRKLKANKENLQTDVKALKDEADKLHAENVEYGTAISRLEEVNK